VIRRRATATGLLVPAWVGVFVCVGISLGTQAASAAQVFYSPQPAVRTTAGAPSRAPAKKDQTHATTQTDAPPVDNVPPANNTPPVSSAPAKGPARAPSDPPLDTGVGTGSAVNGQEEASASAQPSGGDPLADNGLDSPLCEHPTEYGLSVKAVRACQTSGFEGAQAPTGNYAFDVHINDGLTHLGNGVAVLLQDIAQYWWTALVALVRGLIVIFDWCFTLDLLTSHAMSGLTRALRAAQTTFTQPWLALALAIAAMLALYHGMIRRRVAETLGEVLLMLVMMAGGLWVIMNPVGTIGALSAWANEASLGTLAATVGKTPDHPYQTLAESNQEVFSAAIEDPWCYMEFGEVSWCSDTKRLDRPLHEAALKIAHEPEHAPGDSAVLLRDAQTNGELFLALPANEAARNSINESWSLFQVLCGGNSEPCHGSTASEANFRNQSGTWPRVIGLGFISLGLVGMLLLLGFIALRLLYAAIMSLIYLLVTPIVVVAPALGEGGRTAFRMWAARLFGAVVSKLVYSFLLGAILMVQQVILSVHLFGWFTQWLFVASLWWIAYIRRHRIFEISLGGSGGQHRSMARRLGGALESRTGMATVGWAKRRLSAPGPSVERRRRLARAGAQRAKQMADAQVGRGLESAYSAAQAQVDAGRETQSRISAKRTRLGRMHSEQAAAQEQARAAGRARASALNELELLSRPERNRQESKKHIKQMSPTERAERQQRMDDLRRVATKHGIEASRHHKRAVRLQGRMDRLRDEIDGDQGKLTVAQKTVRNGERARSTTGKPYTQAQADEYRRYLDDQAERSSRERDYAGMAGVVGSARDDYEALGSRAQRETRLRIDRELAKHKGLVRATADMTASARTDSVGRGDKRKAGKELAHKTDDWMRSEGHSPPRAASGESPMDAWKREGVAATHAGARRRRSAVLDDAREVSARRKRQLGRDRQ
jgi:hypothetical protein